MKRLLALLLVVTLSVSLIACGDTSADVTNSSINQNIESTKTESSITELSVTESFDIESSEEEASEESSEESSEEEPSNVESSNEASSNIESSDAGLTISDDLVNTENSVSQPNEESSKNETVINTNYVGMWEPADNSSASYIVIKEQTGNILTLDLHSVRGASFQVASCENIIVTLVDGKASFEYMDSFMNTGTCNLSIVGDILTVSYTNTKWSSDWGLHRCPGNYKKTS